MKIQALIYVECKSSFASDFDRFALPFPWTSTIIFLHLSFEVVIDVLLNPVSAFTLFFNESIDMWFVVISSNFLFAIQFGFPINMSRLWLLSCRDLW